MATERAHQIPSTDLSSSDLAALKRVDRLAYWLDDRFRIPGTKRRIGLDGLVGLIPGIGDAVTTTVSAYIIWEAWQLGVPVHLIMRMIWNLLVDSIIGAIPLLGDVFDVAWKANRKNLRLLIDHLNSNS